MDNTFTITDEYGSETTYYVLLTFENERTGDTYIAYTDKTRDQEGALQIYAAVLNYGKSGLFLTSIETEEELEEFKYVLEQAEEMCRKQRQLS